jgi:hypothetical protein
MVPMAELMHAAWPTVLALAVAGYLVFRLIRLIEDGRRQLARAEARRLRELRNIGA